MSGGHSRHEAITEDLIFGRMDQKKEVRSQNERTAYALRENKL